MRKLLAERRPLIRRLPLIGRRPLILRRPLFLRRPLTLRRPLILRRALTLLALVRRRSLIGSALAGTLLILILRRLALCVAVLTLAFRSALRHLSFVRLTFLLVLVLLIGTQHAHDLLMQRFAGASIDRAAGGVGLRVLLDHRLNTLLLISREIQVAEALHPTVLNFRTAGSRMIACVCGRLLLGLLGRSNDRHGERHR